MLQIQCTKKLLDAAKIKAEPVVPGDPLQSWHANLLIINRRKAVVLTNTEARYTVLLWGLKASHFAKLSKVIMEAICETLQTEGVRPEIVEQYIADKSVCFTKTSERGVISVMNQMGDIAKRQDPEQWNGAALNQLNFNLRFGDWLFSLNGNYVHAREKLLEGLARYRPAALLHADASVVCIKAYQLLIRLDLLGAREVWRRVRVPAALNFAQMHEVIQRAFGWGDYHLHEFVVDQKQGKNVFIGSLCEEDAFFQREILDEEEEVLESYLQQKMRVTYVYDFGDDWQHEIRLEKVIENCESACVELLEGSGNTPPEDVGGAPGYENFLEIMADPKHPEHQETKEWAQEQGYKEFNLKFSKVMVE